MKKWFIFVGFLMLMACEHHEQTLDTTYLTFLHKSNSSAYYSANSLDDAIHALPFTLNVPKDLPDQFHPFQLIHIVDQNEPEGKDIYIAVNAKSKEDIHTIGIYAQNYDILQFDDFKKYGEQIVLDNHQIAYYNPPLDFLPWQESHISWVKDNVFYSIEYIGTQYDKENIKQLLINLANQMQ